MIILAAVTSLMLLIAALSGVAFPTFPYGVYILLRIIVCITSSVVAARLFSQKNEKKAAEGLAWTMVITAIIFNPIIPLALGKAIWFIVDVIAAGFILSAAVIADNESNSCTQTWGREI